MVTLNTGGGTIDTSGNDVTLNGSIGNGGVGGLTKTGAGTLSLNGSNNYTGDTTISGGTLSITGDDRLGPADATLGVVQGGAIVLNGGTLSTPGGLTTGRSLVVNSTGGTIDAGFGTVLITDWGHTTLSGNLRVTNGTLMFQRRGSANSGTNGTTTTNNSRSMMPGIQTTNAGAAITIDPGATLNLSSVGYGITPRMHLNGGSLDVSGMFGGFILANKISGAGTISGGVTADTGGTIEPGTTPSFTPGVGTLTFNNDLDLSFGGHYAWDLSALDASPGGAGTSYDQVLANANLTLGGSSVLDLNFSLLPGASQPNGGNAFWDTPHSWKIIDVAGTNTTTFDSITNGIVASGIFSTSIGADADLGDIFLNFTPLRPGDFDLDGDVDGADFVAWQTNFPTAFGATRGQGDADGDGDVDGADFVIWQTNFPFTPGPGTSPVPEPAAWIAVAMAIPVLARTARRRMNRRE